MMDALLIVLCCLAVVPAYGQPQNAEELRLRHYLADKKQAISAAEASTEFIREQLAILRGKLDYYADPGRSNVGSLAELKNHYGDLDEPVREATLRIYSVKETLDSLNSSFTQQASNGEPPLLRMLPGDKYEYAGEVLEMKDLKLRLYRAGSLNRYASVRIQVSKTDSPLILAKVVSACQEAQIRSIYFDERQE